MIFKGRSDMKQILKMDTKWNSFVKMSWCFSKIETEPLFACLQFHIPKQVCSCSCWGLLCRVWSASPSLTHRVLWESNRVRESLHECSLRKISLNLFFCVGENTIVSPYKHPVVCVQRISCSYFLGAFLKYVFFLQGKTVSWDFQRETLAAAQSSVSSSWSVLLVSIFAWLWKHGFRLLKSKMGFYAFL